MRDKASCASQRNLSPTNRAFEQNDPRSETYGALMQVAEKNDPSRQCDDTKHSARNKTRACHFRSCVETFPKENAEEATGKGKEQDYVSGLFQRHTQQERNKKAKRRLDHIFDYDSPAHTPIQGKTVRGGNEACHKQCGAFTRATENCQARINIDWHVELDDGCNNTEHGSPEYRFLESSTQ